LALTKAFKWDSRKLWELQDPFELIDVLFGFLRRDPVAVVPYGMFSALFYGNVLYRDKSEAEAIWCMYTSPCLISCTTYAIRIPQLTPVTDHQAQVDGFADLHQSLQSSITRFLELPPVLLVRCEYWKHDHVGGGSETVSNNVIVVLCW
jgi:hypothetical protein